MSLIITSWSTVAIVKKKDHNSCHRNSISKVPLILDGIKIVDFPSKHVVAQED